MPLLVVTAGMTLLLLEIAASGHVDGAGMALVLACFALLTTARAEKGGGWRIPAAGGLLAAVPRQRRWRFFGGGVAGVLLPCSGHRWLHGCSVACRQRTKQSRIPGFRTF